MSKELFRNAGIYIFVGFLNQGLIFSLWILLARWLEPDQIGVYALAMFTLEFFSTIGLLGLDAAMIRFYYTEDAAPAVLTNGLILLLTSSVAASVLFLTSARWLAQVIPGLDGVLQQDLPLFLAIVLANAFANLAFASYTGRRKAAAYGVLQLLKVVAFSGFAIALVRLGSGIWGLFYSVLMSSVAVVVGFLAYEWREISLSTLSLGLVRRMSAYGSPLMLYGVLAIVAAYFGRLMLDRYTDATALGVYSFFLALVLQVNGVWSSFNRAWTPEIFSRIEHKRVDSEMIWFVGFLSTCAYLTAIMVLAVVGKYFLFRLIFKAPYLMNMELLYVLLLAPVFTGIYTTTYPLYYYQARTGRILFVSVVLMILNISLTFLSVRAFHQIGAAASYFVASTLAPLVYLFAFRRIVHIPRRIWYWMFALSVLMAVAVALLLLMAPFWLFLAVLLLGAALSYWMGDLHGRRQLILRFLGIKRMLEPQRA